MDERSRFVIEMMIRDTQSPWEVPVRMAMGVGPAMRISSRMVDDMKFGAEIGVGLVGFDNVVEMIRTKELRRDALEKVAIRLARAMADRLEDAEGWHDPSRVDPARESLGGKWD